MLGSHIAGRIHHQPFLPFLFLFPFFSLFPSLLNNTYFITMREPNLCFPSQSRAAVCITSALYDRRALDCTATLPLVNSLTHLAYLTSTSPRIREILCLDGGLEKLVRILSQTSSRSDRLTLWKWTLAFQSIVNVGVRGTEQIRTKVVDTGVIPFVLTILGNFTKSYEIINGKKEMKRGKNHNAQQVSFCLLIAANPQIPFLRHLHLLVSCPKAC